MTLDMTGVTKRGKKGLYALRMRVPEAIQARLGKKEIIEALGTADPVETAYKGKERRTYWLQRFDDLKAIESIEDTAVVDIDLAIDELRANLKTTLEETLPSLLEQPDTILRVFLNGEDGQGGELFHLLESIDPRNPIQADARLPEVLGGGTVGKFLDPFMHSNRLLRRARRHCR